MKTRSMARRSSRGGGSPAGTCDRGQRSRRARASGRGTVGVEGRDEDDLDLGLAHPRRLAQRRGLRAPPPGRRTRATRAARTDRCAARRREARRGRAPPARRSRPRGTRGRATPGGAPQHLGEQALGVRGGEGGVVVGAQIAFRRGRRAIEQRRRARGVLGVHDTRPQVARRPRAGERHEEVRSVGSREHGRAERLVPRDDAARRRRRRRLWPPSTGDLPRPRRAGPRTRRPRATPSPVAADLRPHGEREPPPPRGRARRPRARPLPPARRWRGRLRSRRAPNERRRSPGRTHRLPRTEGQTERPWRTWRGRRLQRLRARSLRTHDSLIN